MIDQTNPAPATSRLGGPGSLRILVVGVAAIALAIGAAIALTTPAPASPLMENTSAVGPGPADTDGFLGLAGATSLEGAAAGAPGPGQVGRGGAGARHGGPLRAITIAARDGSNLSLKTEDGWTRTIAVTSETIITKAGIAIQVAALNVGDTIAFRQTRNTDGTFKVVEIRVVVPQTGGEVTAVGGTTLTLKLRDGTSKTVTLTDATKYFIGPKAATKAEIKVGAVVSVQGTISGDTFTGLSVTRRPDVVAGAVTAKTATSLTLKTRNGASVTVSTESTTTFRISGKQNATIADVTVGMQVAAQGSRASETSFNAFAVGSAPAMRDGGRGARGFGPGPGGPGVRGPGPGGPGPGGPGVRVPGGSGPNASPASTSGASAS